MENMQTTKEITITHGNGSVQTITVPIDFDESLLGPISISEEELNSALTKRQIEDHLKFLAETDWYVSRKAETGVDIPEEVLVKRQEARNFISENRQ